MSTGGVNMGNVISTVGKLSLNIQIVNHNTYVVINNLRIKIVDVELAELDCMRTNSGTLRSMLTWRSVPRSC